MLLKNKKILVVGAGGLLGSHTVSVLLSEGAEVIAADIIIEKMQEQLINQDIDIEISKLSLQSLDITNEASVKDFFTTAEHLDGAVNCTYPRNQNYGTHFLDVKLSDFNENVSLHLGSTFLFTQQCAVYYLRCQAPFSLVNVSSVYGVIAPKFSIYNNTNMTMPVEYAAIKSALIHLNKYVVKYINDSNFKVNSVSPGGILDTQPEAFLEAYKGHTLGKGMLSRDDVTGTILFLLSAHSKHVNGQNIVVDDGFSL